MNTNGKSVVASETSEVLASTPLSTFELSGHVVEIVRKEEWFVATVENAHQVQKLRCQEFCEVSGEPLFEVGDLVSIHGFHEALPDADGYAAVIEHFTKCTLSRMPQSRVPGPSRSAFRRIASTIDALEVKELAAMLNRIFTSPEIFQGFFIAKASTDCHHDFPGGLAAHTAEVLDFVLAVPVHLFSNRESREALIAAILLHDITKYRTARQGFVNLSVSHEARLLALIGGDLQELASSQSSICEFIIYLFDACMHRRSPPVPEVHIYQAADRVSASSDVARKAFSTAPSWASTAVHTLSITKKSLRSYRAVQKIRP